MTARLRSTMAALVLLLASIPVIIGAAHTSPASAATNPGCPMWADTAVGVGMTPAEWSFLSPKLWRESRCIPTKIGRTQDYGLAQIHCARKVSWCARYGLTRDQLLDPGVNLFVAMLVLRDPWGGRKAWGR